MNKWHIWILVGLSLTGALLVTSKSRKTRVVSFIIWLMTDILWVIHYFTLGQYPAMALFGIYTIFCIVGIYNNFKWR